MEMYFAAPNLKNSETVGIYGTALKLHTWRSRTLGNKPAWNRMQKARPVKLTRKPGQVQGKILNEAMTYHYIAFTRPTPCNAC